MFSAPIIVIMFVADYLFSNYLRESRFGEYGVWNDIYNGKINADVVVYGSSRAMVHMDPQIIKDSTNLEAYNLGINGHNFWLQYFRHQELLQHNKSPKFIIHSVDIFTLVKREDLFNLEQFLPYMFYNREIEKWISSYRGYKKADFYFPLIRYYGHYKTLGSVLKSAFVENDNDSSRYLGFAAMNLVWNDDLEKAKKKFSNFHVQIDPKSVELFDKYLKECNDNGIGVALVYTPEYIEGQEFVKNREEIMSYFRYFSAKYNIPFYDYSSDPMSFKKEFFYNASHLNSVGARLFTSKMIHDIKRDKSVLNMLYHTEDEGGSIHQASLKVSLVNNK